MDQVSVADAPALMDDGLAESVSVGGIGRGGVTTTAADTLTLMPFAPSQVSANVLFATSGTLISEPIVSRTPDHAPDAWHCVVFDDVQVIVAVAPAVKVEGLAAIDAVGALGGGGTTLTFVEDSALVFAAPEQVRMNVLLVASGPIDSDPLVALVPNQAPDAMHVFAFDDAQVTIEDAPDKIDEGLAAIEIVGGGGGGCVTFTPADA